MRVKHGSDSSRLVYRVGLDRLHEAVISSHFMNDLCRDARLGLYDDEQLSARSVSISARAISEDLLPGLLKASERFAGARANAAKHRAIRHCHGYGLDPAKLGPAELITEVMFDRQFRRGPRETCSRRVVRDKVEHRIAAGAPIEMAIPALPYKFSCPLKTRGQLPDLAEANFLLGLYEIVAAVEVLYREARPSLRGPLARFTVVSDGSRFNRLVNEPDVVIEAYRGALGRWIEQLGLGEHIELLDYNDLLRDRMSKSGRDHKEALRKRALQGYADTMWALFDPCDMATTLGLAARHDLDPEEENPEGRFASLMKSLVYTVNYRSLERYRTLPAEQFRAIYRELTAHIFEPFVAVNAAQVQRFAEQVQGGGDFVDTPATKECLRQAMLTEVWRAAIAYIAEIKSDREQANDPIATCLPDHLRWTIHAKPGQLGLQTPSAMGKFVQAWAGAAVFKRARQGGIKLCTLPVLALEGAGAVPVWRDDGNHVLGSTGQPLFYVYPDVELADLDDFVAGLARRVVRKRVS